MPETGATWPERRENVRSYFVLTPPTDDGFLWVHRDVGGPEGVAHLVSPSCWCEPLVFRRSEFATAAQVMAAVERAELLN